jgi:Cu(I)/Ag(I) efflux system membrane protein CusA/SilA
MHKRLEEWDHQHPGEQIDNASRWKVITNASVEVGPALFISLLIITLSFIQSLPWKGRKGVVWPTGVHENVFHGGRPRWQSSSFRS